MSKKLYVQVPSYIVRNDGIFLSNGDFLLYARLCFLYFRNFKNEEIKINHTKLMFNLRITDTRTLKKRLNALYKCKLIKNEVTKLPKRGEITILFDSSMLTGHFTQLAIKVFDQLEFIDEHSFRLMFYYKSHINMDDKNNKRDFCFVGIETLKYNLKMGGTTVNDANKLLKKQKMVKIVKHKLEESGAYNEDDELVIDKYNNHYYIHHDYL